MTTFEISFFGFVGFLLIVSAVVAIKDYLEKKEDEKEMQKEAQNKNQALA